MLTYADVCRRTSKASVAAALSAAVAAQVKLALLLCTGAKRTQLTCLTSTKVQILTRVRRVDALPHVDLSADVC